MKRDTAIKLCWSGAATCAVALAVLLSGCVQEPPTPFKTGAEVIPPYGCVEYRKRGGEC